jgi:hypothetical protein
VEKYRRVGQATDDNTAHAHCMLDTENYRHAFRICNTELIFHTNNNCTNVPVSHIINIFSVLFIRNLDKHVSSKG